MEKNYDDMLNKLNDIIKELEDENTSVEKSFELFKEGMENYNNCKKRLDEIHKEVLEIIDN